MGEKTADCLGIGFDEGLKRFDNPPVWFEHCEAFSRSKRVAKRDLLDLTEMLDGDYYVSEKACF